MLTDLWIRLRSLFRRNAVEDELDAELRFHFDQHVEKLVHSGLPRAEARRRARLEFGGLDQVKEECRDARGTYFVETLAQDVRSAIRGLRRHPGFALAVILTAAMGIGATTAVFSVVDRILFRSLPYAHEDRLVSVGMMAPLDTNEFLFASPYFDLRRNHGPFEAVTSFQAGSIACDLTDQNPVRLACLKVESNFLDALGMSPLVGRMFNRAEDVPNGPHVADVSYGLWRSRFASDPHIVGRTIPIDGFTTEIVGVLPKDFEVPTLTRADVLLPEQLNEATETSGRAFRVFARLRPGTTIRQSRAQLDPYFARALQTVPAPFRKEITLRVRSIRDYQVDDVRVASLALFGSVLAVLLIACANVANLLLARATNRQRELAIHAVLGATRSRLARSALTESLILSMIAGTLGCALAYALLRIFVAIAPAGLPRLDSATVDLRVLLFALVLSLGSGIAFGIAPALRVPAASLLAGWHATSVPKGGLRSALVSIQIAVSIVLLTGAGLLLRSLWKLQSVPVGVEASHVVMAHFELGRQRYAQTAQQVVFFSQLERRAQVIPGGESFAISDSSPLSGREHGRPLASIAVEGRPPRPEGTGGMVDFRYVTPGYFSTLGIPIINGRGFSEQDRAANEYSVVLSNLLARILFLGQDPIGQQILKDPPGPWFTVIGVAGDVKNLGPASDAEPEYYLVRKGSQTLGFEGESERSATLSVRTAIDPALVVPSIRSAIAEIDPTLPVETQTITERLDEIIERPRFNALLLSGFAGIGALLAASGLFGVMSFLVAQRTREIGVRMALGATPAQIVRWTLERAFRWVAPGVLFGVLGSYAVAHVLRSLLFEVTPNDPKAVASALILLSTVATLAALLPARRAAGLDPMAALREE
jgi:predicted permease